MQDHVNEVAEKAQRSAQSEMSKVNDGVQKLYRRNEMCMTH